MTALNLTSAQLANANELAEWQLNTSTAGGANFVQAWSQTDATGILISIVDEGVNYTHTDFVSGVYDTSVDYDPRDTGTMDAMPDTAAQHHGTEVASLIIGSLDKLTAGVGTGGDDAIGAAQGAHITGSYMRFGTLYNFNDLTPILTQQKYYDVSNNSWGYTSSFTDNFQTTQFAPVLAALQADVQYGRAGLGTAMVFAAGNDKIIDLSGNPVGDDVNFHNFTNSRFTITVGGLNADGSEGTFSNPGVSLLISAPAVGLIADDGTAVGSTNTAYFSGTSGAAPLVSSTVALMLAANHNLGYRDEQEILALSSTSHSGSTVNGAHDFNGGGMLFNRDVGFGMLDASAAVALARNWDHTSTLANEKEVDFSFTPTSGMNSTSSSLSFSLSAASGWGKFSTEHVDLDLSISDADLADLQFNLVSPSGTVSKVADHIMLNTTGQTYLSFTFGDVQFMGENPYGNWTLQFSHATPSGTFDVSQADVHIYGDILTADDTYYYSSIYPVLVGMDATRSHAVDTDGGTDTLNFAGADTPVTIDLSGATSSSLDSTPIHLDSAFENVVGTIYNDTILGSSVVNKLIGDLGNDTLDGGVGGPDILIGGLGNDTYILHNSGDVVIENAGEGTDTVMTGMASYLLAANVENLTGTGSGSFTGMGNALDNLIIGNAGTDYLIGFDGNDIIIDGSGAAVLQGGTGNDIYAVQSTADTVLEFAGEGTDQVQTFLSVYTLSANVENLTFTGTVDHTGIGNASDNVMIGNTGNDFFNGLGGSNTMTGGAGYDQFVFSTALSGNVETITDFTPNVDRMLFDHTIFTAVGATGSLASTAFTTGAETAATRFVYDTTTGFVSYDADGSGSGAAVHFATLTGHPSVTAADFLIV